MKSNQERWNLIMQFRRIFSHIYVAMYVENLQIKFATKKKADPFACFMKAAADLCKDGFLRDVLSNHVQVKEDAFQLQKMLRSSKAKFKLFLGQCFTKPIVQFAKIQNK